jgi:hypothetical protein
LIELILLLLSAALQQEDQLYKDLTASADYQKLVQDWWTWLSAIPEDQNHPLRDHDGSWTMEANAKYNKGDVYFLTGAYNVSATRNITVPYGTPIFFPVLDGGYWYAPNMWEKLAIDFRNAVPFLEDVDIYKTMKEMARIDLAYNWSASLDGKPLESKRVETVYTTHYPPGTFYAYSDDSRTGGDFLSFVDGYWVYIPRLERGNHELYYAAVSPDYVTEAMVNLDVR